MSKTINISVYDLQRLEEENENLREENEELKEKLELTENDRDEREMKAKELKKELDKLRTDNIYEEGLYS